MVATVAFWLQYAFSGRCIYPFWHVRVGKCVRKRKGHEKWIAGSGKRTPLWLWFVYVDVGSIELELARLSAEGRSSIPVTSSRAFARRIVGVSPEYVVSGLMFSGLGVSRINTRGGLSPGCKTRHPLSSQTLFTFPVSRRRTGQGEKSNFGKVGFKSDVEKGGFALGLAQ